MLEVCVGTHAEGELGFADDRVLVLAEVVAEPEDHIRVECRVDVEVHAEELEFVFLDFGIRIVVFEAQAESELLCDVEARFDGEEHLVFGEHLRGGFVILVGDCVEVVKSQVENAVVQARFEEEGVNGIALVRVEAVDGVDAVVEDFEALGVVKFCAEEIGVTTTDFGTEYPVYARGDGQVFVRAIQKLKAVAAEHGNCALAVVRGANVELAVAELVVANFDTETANALVTGNHGVAACITPEVVIESTCVVSQVTEDEAYVLERSPAEFYAVKVECGVAVCVAIDGGRTGEAMADFCGLVGVRNIALGVREYGHGNVFVEISLDGQVDVLVCGVGGVKIPVEITSEVEIDISVNFDIGGRGKTGSGEGNRQNEFTHTILPKKDLLIFTCKR